MGKKDKKEENFGSSLKFDPTFNGPLKKRSCTDVLCLLLFIAFLAAWAIAGIFAFKYGDPARLLVPTDSEGYRCGMDDIVKDKKFLVFFDLSKCATPNAVITGCDTPQVCVEKCPVINFSSDLYAFPGINSPFTDQDKLICKYHVNVTNIVTVAQMRARIKNEDCASWYLTSQHLSGRCVPNPLMINHTGETVSIEGTPITDVSYSEILESIQVVAGLSSANEIGQMMVEDLSKSWYWILAMLLLAMICCLIFIVLMRWFAGIMVWISLIGVHVLLGYGIYACYAKYKELEAANEEVSLAGLTIEEQAKALMAKKETWMAFLIIISIILAIVLLLTIFLRSRIVIAIALIGEASKAVGSVTSTLAFPLVPWVLQCIVIAWTVALVLFLASSGTEVFKVTGLGNGTECVCESGATISDGSVCDLTTFNETCKACPDADCHFYKFETDKYVLYLHVINIFGLFWGLFFVSALGEMVLASTFATWYWTYNKSDVPFFTLTQGLLRTVRYNLGTLAFGSLILAICRMIRVVLEFVDNQLKKYDNFVTRCMLCCCKCFFWCLENFIKFLNRNAYIMCAVHGKGFCASAKDAFNLLMRNVIRVFVLDKVTDFLLLLGKLLITAGICALAFFLFEQKLVIPVDELEFPSLNYSWLPIFLVTVGTYFIATIFFGVYAMAVDTLFLCFLEDTERNDGSIEKPYFMSKSLRKIIGKKNKKAK